MTDEELKNKCTERAKIFQQAMESCHSSSPIDCIEWFADRIADLEKENAELKEKYVKECEDVAYVVTNYNKQLTKAKDLLTKWVELFKPKGGNIPPTPIQVDTEQFLNEVEK